jgi:hypothetical protein
VKASGFLAKGVEQKAEEEEEGGSQPRKPEATSCKSEEASVLALFLRIA